MVSTFILAVINIAFALYVFIPHHPSATTTAKITPQPQNSSSIISPSPLPVIDKSIFVNLDTSLLTQDTSIPITHTPGFMVMNAIMSHQQDRVVYSEISDCIGAVNAYDPGIIDRQCNWQYRIYIKTKNSADKIRLYGYPEDKLSWLSTLTPQAYAGGCPLVYLPIGWSSKDTNIIVESVNPTSCGAGGGTTKYTYASINSRGGPVQGISKADTKFYGDFAKAIVVGESQTSPEMCGPINQRNFGKLTFLDLESGQIIKTIEAADTSYTLGDISESDNQFTYTTQPLSEVDGCGQLDANAPETAHTIPLL